MPQHKPDMLVEKLQVIVEALCNEGCEAVTQYIKQIEAGHLPEPLLLLSPQEQDQVLHELKQIMSVYDHKLPR